MNDYNYRYRIWKTKKIYDVRSHFPFEIIFFYFDFFKSE